MAVNWSGIVSLVIVSSLARFLSGSAHAPPCRTPRYGSRCRRPQSTLVPAGRRDTPAKTTCVMVADEQPVSALLVLVFLCFSPVSLWTTAKAGHGGSGGVNCRPSARASYLLRIPQYVRRGCRGGDSPQEHLSPPCAEIPTTGIPPCLLNDADLDLVGDQEMQAYYMLKDQIFAHTRAYDPELLKKIGMDVNSHTIWKVVGWQRFAVADEPGSRLLTLQFRGDLRPIREDKLIIMFVTVRKIKVAPVKCAMVDHIGTHATWREMNKKVQHPCKCTKPVRNQLGMHPDGPKLYTIASEARSGRVPARADREHLMTYTGEHEHSFPQIKHNSMTTFKRTFASRGSILIKDPERKASLVGDVSPPAEILFMLYD
uniref:Uncharacterized protein n=1 Tax=Oryza sativa subsp. japonica TaxID=39947 RepID=Q9AYC6_ORYSJ|nr:Hypothetical protein [Oryza sativa Japonica Group]